MTMARPQLLRWMSTGLAGSRHVLGRAGRARPRARSLAIRTVVGDDVCPRANGVPPNLSELDEALGTLRAGHPGAIIERYLDKIPSLHPTALVCTGAAVVGDVRVAEDVQVWYGAVLRGDLNYIEVGPRSNIQDGTVVHLGDNDPAVIGADVVIGHRAVIHGCTIRDACLIGMNATVLDGAVIGKGSMVGAGAVVPAGLEVPEGSLVLGVPGKIVKSNIDKEEFIRSLAAKYTRLAYNHRNG